ncbi:Tubulin-folding cofactor C-like protein [Melia azedarach]|uniref:Tubulin-folding cofactor C-like protein n=2 Tax=Melia azedarach TaxID=155640 RepID=A0ACC1XNT8_MELAZ|nr:Tubulin-folding cofactor C-like protein [Melia azedarach]KAJ4713152.1 Tubulin-folding cofactor C-like protein [Melia azedarach]
MEDEIANQRIADDEAFQKKRQLMLERLSARHQTRLETRKSDSPDPSSTSTFFSRFNDLKKSITCQIESGADPSRLPDISSSISDLEKLVAENSYALPSYEVRSSLKTISDLKQNLDHLSAKLVPKKKFSFKNKAVKKETPIVTQNTESGAVSLPDLKNKSFPVRDSPGFRDKENQVLVKNFKGTEIGEFTISGLDSCEVKLIGCVNALFINRLKNCKIYAGPVMGSILIEEVENCVLVLASHQIRIHFAKRSDFYLRVRSRPIIEDSYEVRFAPYCLKYDRIEEDLKAASLNEEAGNWANVDDFKWLRAVQSPNWSVLPEEDRIESVDLVDLECGNGTS